MSSSAPALQRWTPPPPDAVPGPFLPREDRHTLSNPKAIRTTHTHIDWAIDWAAQLIKGKVTHSMLVTADGVSEALFDTSYLAIDTVAVDGKPAAFSLDPRKGRLGSALHVSLMANKGATPVVEITYSTTDKCTALGWLTKEQTAGKTAPFLYSQCEAIHGRALLPCQDTPAYKMTYTSSVKSEIPVLMSALPTHGHEYGAELNASSEIREYTFEQKISIPTYLIAILGGHVAFRSLGPRTGVYAEPPLADKAQWEFEADAEKFLAAAEKLVSPYSWTRYDCVILPPSFPMGGMENANLTTLTPSLITGTRSLTDVVAHELMHSWAGNLTSCADWPSFWCNESWTVYLERLVLQEVHGGYHSADGRAARGFSYIIGAKALQDALAEFRNNPRFQRLVPVFHGFEDPDDAFSSIPYEKGSNLLLYLEHLCGGLDVFLPYVKAYFKAFFDRSVTTDEWQAHLFTYFESNSEILSKLKAVEWGAWLHGEGEQLPVDMTPYYDDTLAVQAFALAKRWQRAIAAGSSAAAGEEFVRGDVADFNANQVVVFLERLHSGPEVPLAIVQELDSVYALSKETNGEILLRFFEVALEQQTSPYAMQAAAWVQTQGRMKFARPIYRALFKLDQSLARTTFEQARAFYHPIAVAQLEKDLKLIA